MTFPGMLSDDQHPTTALAAVGNPVASSSAFPFVLPPGAPTVPPVAGDRLPVVPLPAQRVLAASPVVTNPRDPLTTRARDASTPDDSTLAAPGTPGRFVLQVSSFKTEPEAVSFARIIRQRGHHAYVEAAQIPGRGTWHRVRLGPFKTAREANAYRTEFERKEHIVPFLIETEKERAAREAPPPRH
ncbi:MAG: SPOR domain-containing protein [Polyangiaceae bacterium]